MALGLVSAACTDDAPDIQTADPGGAEEGSETEEQGSDVEADADSGPGATPPEGGGPPPGVGSNQGDEEHQFSPRVRKGEFTPLGSGASQELEGAASLLRLPDGETLLNIDIEGLEPRRPYDAYLHTGSCKEGGGDLYLFEPGSAPSHTNKHGGPFQADAKGEAAEVSFKHSLTAGREASSVVVTEKGGGRVACADMKPTK